MPPDFYSDAHKKRLTEAIDGLEPAPGGDSYLWTAILDALHVPGMDDASKINTIIVLSSGVGHDPEILDQLTAELRNRNRTVPVQVLAVPYGQAADLQLVVTDSQGRLYDDEDEATVDDWRNVGKVSEFVCGFL